MMDKKTLDDLTTDVIVIKRHMMDDLTTDVIVIKRHVIDGWI